MAYFVIGDDGKRYGPADVPALNQWILEGRLLATTLLEEEGSGARLAAGSVSGLNFPIQPQATMAPPQNMGPNNMGQGGPAAGPTSNPYSQPAGQGPMGQGPMGQGPMGQGQGNPYASGPAGGGYYRPPQGSYGGDEGKNELIASWAIGTAGICCCGVLGPLIGIVLGFVAKSKGNQGALAAIIVNAILFVLIGIFTLIMFPTYMKGFNQGLQQSMQQQRQQQPAVAPPATAPTTG